MNRITTLLKKTLIVAALLGMTTAFFGCHTAHGFGQDVERTGEKIQDKTQ
jgi:predicted small secreted protein